MVEVDGIVPSNDARVPPSTFDSACMYASARTPTPRLVASVVAWLVDVARTCTAPPGAENEELERTIASVVASLSTRASATVTAIGMTPTATAVDSTSAKLSLVDCTVVPPASVTSVDRSTFVPPRTRAVGTETPTARRPPAARSVCAFEWLFESAVTSTRPRVTPLPGALRLPSPVPFTSTSASLVISESTTEAAMEPPKPTSMTRISASARFWPLAVMPMAGLPGVFALEVVLMSPSIWTRTAPSMVAMEIMAEVAERMPTV